MRQTSQKNLFTHLAICRFILHFWDATARCDGLRRICDVANMSEDVANLRKSWNISTFSQSDAMRCDTKPDTLEDVANLRKTHFAKVEILQLSPRRTKDVFLVTVQKRYSIRTGNHVKHALTPEVTSDLVSAPERVAEKLTPNAPALL